MAKKKIGILTGGGDVPGLNSVIKSVVLAALALVVAAVSPTHEELIARIQSLHKTVKQQDAMLESQDAEFESMKARLDFLDEDVDDGAERTDRSRAVRGQRLE